MRSGRGATVLSSESAAFELLQAPVQRGSTRRDEVFSQSLEDRCELCFTGNSVDQGAERCSGLA